MTASRTGVALLEFSRELNDLGDGKELRHGLSAVLRIGDTLWLANDETASLERLSRLPSDDAGRLRYGDHTQFALDRYLTLPAPPDVDDEGGVEEVDVEGLAYDGGYLWLVGSHSRKRRRPKRKQRAGKNRKRLATVHADGNRYLLARIPVVAETHTLAREIDLVGGERRVAAQLGGDARGNALTDALANDEHVGPFFAVPGKDNGFDIEGLAVVGRRVFVGLRGPVLRGWAIVLELELEGDGADLTLKKIGPDDRAYRKHFLSLDGLGVRDLIVQGDDLLILAGPTMDLDGPVAVYRWPGGANPSEESVVFDHTVVRLLDLPFGRGDGKGRDHAEGITLLASTGGGRHALLVVYDAPSEARQVASDSAVEADIFALP